MRRRDFLYNSGLLLPALFLSPSLALAEQQTINAQVLIIQDPATLPAHVPAVFTNLPVQVQQLDYTHVTNLIYSKKGFEVTSIHNAIIRAQKVVVQSPCRINLPRFMIEIAAGKNTFHLQYHSTVDSNKAVPELWLLKTSSLQAHRATSFISRNKHAVLCLDV